ncbi:MAG: ComF family protein [Bacteroidales bacterium]|nr:ComF family protein [Bacteroidales bacterium]
MKLKAKFKDLLALFYPNLCVVCSEHLLYQEEYICTKCLYNLPKTKFHLDENNPVAQLFWGRTKIENATALYYYTKGSKYQKMIHKFKYNGVKEIGFVLGKVLGNEIKNSKFKDIDIIIPVPLHPKKLRKRGYNQSDWIAMGLGKTMKNKVDCKNLYRNIHTSSQTNKSRFERWKNVENIFELKNKSQLLNKHILLVDDVVTTGSTLEACANIILKIQGTRVSIITLAIAWT